MTTIATPLIDLGLGEYKGERGGLYDAGSNAAPDWLEARKHAAVDQIGGGKIGFVSLGMSNTREKFESFMSIARNRTINNDVVIVNGAQGHMDARRWGISSLPWENLQPLLAAEQIGVGDVQVLFMLHALIRPARSGEYPKHAQRLSGLLQSIANRAENMFPNLRLIYLTSRTFAGYSTTDISPEPYAYESAFAVRNSILEQPPRAAPIVWGPYLWADGTNPRSDGVTYERTDFARDGMHPSADGARKAGNMLFEFFEREPWFV